jgi:putative tricarboxylic transport membrane protein
LSSEAGASSAGHTGGGAAAAPAPSPKPYWLALVIIAIAAVWLFGAAGLPQGARYAIVGPGLFVALAGFGLLVCGLILFVQIARGERFEPQDVEDAAASSPMDRRAFMTALAAVAVPVVGMPHLGTPLVATISFALVARAFGSKRLLLDILTGAILGVVVYVFFTRLGLQLGGWLPLLRL